jgi:hypothetical protein
MVVHASCTYDGKAVHVEQAARESMEQKSLALALTAFPLRQLSRSSDISQMGILTYILPAAYLKFPGCFPALISHPLTYFFLLLFNF